MLRVLECEAEPGAERRAAVAATLREVLARPSLAPWRARLYAATAARCAE